jgi:hypothetical protein
MPDEYWDKLINHHLDGVLSEEERSEFERIMLQSESARIRFWELAEVHGLAQDASRLAWGEGDQNINRSIPTPSSIEDKVRSVQQESKSSTNSFWTKSAAMLLFGTLAGILSTSLVWAISLPEINTPAILLSESFETGDQPQVTGIPNKINAWSGDITQLSPRKCHVEPLSGETMLQFMSADYEGKPNPGGYIADVYRLLDLRDYQEQLSESQSVIQISANFNSCKYSKEKELLYSISLYAIDHESLDDNLISNRVNLQDVSLATSQRSREILDRDPQTWQQSVVELRLPPDTEYVLVRIAVAHSRKNKNLNDYEFDGQFLDLVNVSLIHNPLQNLHIGE